MVFRLGSEIEIDCRQEKKTGQFLCTATKGDKKAKVLAQMDKTGDIALEQFRGSKSLIDEIRDYIPEVVQIKLRKVEKTGDF